jgi:chromate reductase, NAD(P)H dehydrogenase (quinone)
MKLLAISGSLRRESHNTKLLRAAQDLLPPSAQLELFDGLADVPPYNEDDDVDPAPAAVRRFRDAIAAADAVLIATPEYNASIPGHLKNALDWASRPFPGNALHGKPIAVIGASSSMFGAVWAQAELRKVLGAIGARVIDRDLPISLAEEAFDAQFKLVDDENREELAEILAELVAEAARSDALQPAAA